MTLLIGLVMGTFLGVFLMALLRDGKNPVDAECCNGDCNQGRNCPIRRK